MRCSLKLYFQLARDARGEVLISLIDPGAPWVGALRNDGESTISPTPDHTGESRLPATSTLYLVPLELWCDLLFLLFRTWRKTK